MNKPIDWIGFGSASRVGDDTVLYPLDELKAKFDVRELAPGWLVLRGPNENNWMTFAVMEFAESETSGANTLVSCVFHGEGPGGKDSLRECRHTYWGEDGYIFYPNGEIITNALAALREFFDLD